MAGGLITAGYATKIMGIQKKNKNGTINRHGLAKHTVIAGSIRLFTYFHV
jgi:hypothetical protein